MNPNITVVKLDNGRSSSPACVVKQEVRGVWSQFLSKLRASHPHSDMVALRSPCARVAMT